jgi:hypothetical protein
MTRTRTPGTGVRADAPAPPSAPTATARLRTRLQLAFAGLWLLDGLLQFQPYMFTRNFATQTLLPAALGNPGWIADPVTWSAHLIENHPVPANTAFALIQVALGLGIAHRRTRAAALVCSAVWAGSVWYFGEGLGGLATGQANPLTGAPGSAAVYLLAAILLLPGHAGAPGPAAEPGPGLVFGRTPAVPAAFPAAGRIGEHAAKSVWSAFWLILAYLTLLPVNREPGAFGGALTGGTMGAGEPSWFTALDGHAANVIGEADLAVAVVLSAVLVLIAAAVWVPDPRVQRAGLVLAVLLAAAYWVFGQAFGMPFLGTATDPNTGPLLALLAAAYWPARRAPRTAPAPAAVRGAVTTIRQAGAA